MFNGKIEFVKKMKGFRCVHLKDIMEKEFSIPSGEQLTVRKWDENVYSIDTSYCIYPDMPITYNSGGKLYTVRDTYLRKLYNDGYIRILVNYN